MVKKCVYCMQPIPAGKRIVECKKCKGVLHAIYCSPKCMKLDAPRHQDECWVVNNIEGLSDELKTFCRKTGPPDTDAVYKCGQAILDKSGPGFDCRRQLPGTKKGVKRGAPEEWDHMNEWKKRFVEGSNACCKPWVNFASDTSVMVTWLPPSASGRFADHTYSLEQRIVPDPDSDQAGSPEAMGAWEVTKESHTGTTPSWWVSKLTTGDWIQFRVRATGPAEWAEKGSFSEPSDPMHVGYADFSPVPVPAEGLPASDFSDAEKKFFKTLDHPKKIQDFIDTIPMNHEAADETNYSALETLRQNHGHCIEGAQLAAYIMSLNGYPPYMLDMIAHEDDCHNIVPFRINGKWGAISVSNHSSLRYRNPVYKTIRELMMSYFDDYMNGKGERSLYQYTQPFNLDVVFGPRWATRRGDVWPIANFGSQMKVYKLINEEELPSLRQADWMMLATTVHQRAWRCPDNFDEEAAKRNENK